MKWNVHHIREVRNLVTSEFQFQPKVVRTYIETTSLKHSIEFHNKLFYNEKAVHISIIKLPPSKQVILTNETGQEINFIFKSSSSKLMYELSEYYWIGVNRGNREERFKKLYLVYEELESKPDEVLKAIRHSLSHTRSSLTRDKTKVELINVFGDTKIDLKKYKHAKIFKTKLDLLTALTKPLYLEKVLTYMNESSRFEQYYIN